MEHGLDEPGGKQRLHASNLAGRRRRLPSMWRVWGGNRVRPLRAVRALDLTPRVADPGQPEHAADRHERGGAADPHLERGHRRLLHLRHAGHGGQQRLARLLDAYFAATTAPSAATVIRLAIRAIALLTPDAMPALCSSASASTVAVSGVTVATRPSANNSCAGSSSVR